MLNKNTNKVGVTSSTRPSYSLESSLLPASMQLSSCDSAARRAAVPVLFGEEKPKPWDATLPPPALKVPAGFCSPNDELAKPPNVLAPLFPNRLEASDERKTRVRLSRRSMSSMTSRQGRQAPQLGVWEEGEVPGNSNDAFCASHGA